MNADKIRACYWGIALGDAFGMPVEFKKIEDIWITYGMDGILELDDRAEWTDDTEMTIAVTNALIRLGTPDDIMNKMDMIPIILAEEFIKWYDNPGIAPGLTCTSSVKKLIQHGPSYWNKSGDNGSRGCGAVMRVAPVGLWFSNYPDVTY